MLVAISTLIACGDTTNGVVIEKYEARAGVPQTFGCLNTEWLLVIDQGERIKSKSRFVKKCVSYVDATKYNIGDEYP
jgi:hypothetical protein